MEERTKNFRLAMRALAGGVCIVASSYHGRRAGLTATAVCSVAMDPPSLLICLEKQALAHRQITDSGRFTINILRGDQRYLADLFAGRAGIRGSRKFEASSHHWRSTPCGLPVLRDSLAVVACTLSSTAIVGSHAVCVGFVDTVKIGTPGRSLIYYDGAYHEVGELADKMT